MEKENKKERDKAKREFNELVRRLAEFARKKDPRVLNWAKEQAALKLEKEAQDKESKLKQAAEVKAKQEAARVAQQAQLDSIDLSGMDLQELMSEKDLKRHKHLLGHDDEDGEDDIVEEFYCPACKKVFKSDKQFKNHENSKKHKDMAAKLRKELMAEDEAADAAMAKSQPKGKQTSAKATAAKKGKFVPDDDGFMDDDEDIFVDDDDLFIQDLATIRNADDDLVHIVTDDVLEDDSLDSEEDETILADLSQYRLHEAGNGKEASKSSEAASTTDEPAPEADDDDGDDDDDMLNMMASAKASKSRFTFEDDDDEGEDDAEVDISKLTPKKSFNFTDFVASLPGSSRSSPAAAPAPEATETVVEPEGKKKRRRAPKDKAEKPAAAPVPEPEPEYERGAKRGGKGKKGARAAASAAASAAQHVDENSCRTCGSSFASKTALHTHLKETKHAIAN